jgi:hypothetical protein
MCETFKFAEGLYKVTGHALPLVAVRDRFTSLQQTNRHKKGEAFRKALVRKLHRS